MTTFLGSSCRVTLWIKLLGIILIVLVLREESYGIKILSTSHKRVHPVNPPASSHNCATYIDQYEKEHRIPTGLLQAISKIESGRKDDTGRTVAWPWTINAEGQGYYFPTKGAAIAAVDKMRDKGIKSIDVGCMQVNLVHHPDAFKTLEDAFDPSQNVAYAARFLKGLKNERGSWDKAVAHYHSANPLHHIPYQRNVINLWNREMKTGGILLTAGVFENVSQPKINRLHRLTSAKTLSLKSPLFVRASHKGVVRRVINTSSPSSRIHRVHTKSHRKTLKIS